MAADQVSGQEAAADGTGGSFGVAFPGDVTAGSLIAVSHHIWSTPNAGTVSDNNSNTYSQVDFDTISDTRTESWRAYNVNSGATTVSCVAGGDDRSIVIKEFSGVQTSAEPAEANNANNGTTSTMTTGAFTASANALVIGCFGCQDNTGAKTVGSGYTKAGVEITSTTYAPNAMEWKISSGASENPDMGNGGAGPWAAVGVSFLEATAGGGTFIPIVGRGPGMALAGRGGLAG